MTREVGRAHYVAPAGSEPLSCARKVAEGSGWDTAPADDGARALEAELRETAGPGPGARHVIRVRVRQGEDGPVIEAEPRSFRFDAGEADRTSGEREVEAEEPATQLAALVVASCRRREG